MTLPPEFRRVLAVVAAILLLAGGWLGITSGVHQWPQSTTTGQRLQTASQVVYGVFALLSLVTAFRWRQLQLIANVAFTIGVMSAAALAARVWGGAAMDATLIAGLAALVIAGVTVMMLRAGVAPSPPRQAGDRT